tara:strand:+ start:1080 stop:2708 length:1629 start_codon:yes stop_codon:yes gene_type:complete
MSYYGYERLRPGDALGIDMAEVTKSLSDDLKAYEKKKADDAAGVATTSREFAELLGKMPTSFNQEYNRFFGDTSQAAMQSASKVNTDFRNGEIDKRTYDILMANLNSQVSMTVDSMTKYATMVNDLEEKKAAGELSDEELFKLSQLQEFSDLGNVSIAFDPESYQASLIKIGEGMKGGYDIMSINQYFNGINMKFQGKYDTAGAITSTLKNLTGVQDITSASGKQEVGRFISTTEGKEALKNASEAMLSQPTALRGFAMANTIKDGEDTVNFEYASVPMEYYEVGGILTEEKLKELQDKNPYTFYQDKSGRFYESDKAKEVILKNAQDMLKGAADYTLVEPKVTTETDDSFNKLRQTINTVKDAGFQPSAKMVRALLKKSGLSQDQINSFTGEFIQKDRDIEEANKKKFSANAQQTFKEWFPNWLSETPPGGAKKYDYNTVVSMFETSPFEIVSEGGSIKVLYDGEEFYDFGQKSVRVPQPNMSAEDKKATFDFFKNKMRAKLGDEESIKIMLTIDPSLRKDILNIEDVNTTDTSDVDYSNL